MDEPEPIPTTISRYEATCTICSSSIHPGERIFCFIPPTASRTAVTIDSNPTALTWAHKSCHHPNIPPPPPCRHWTRLGRCPAFQAEMCAFLHLPSHRGSSSSLSKTRWGGKRHFTRNQHKNSVFRIFLMQTYGIEYLTRQHSTIVDIAGGKGELSWELLNLSGVHDCLVIDPRPLNLDLVKRKWSKGLYEPQRTGPVFSKWYPACEVGCKRRESRSPSHLRCFFSCREFVDFQDVDGKDLDSKNAWLDSEIERAKRIVWTTKGLQHEDGSDYNEVADQVALLDATTNDNSENPTIKNTSTEITDATIARTKLKRCHLLIGLHPDQAAGDIVDYALSKNIPYCIVPCCVYSQLFTKRKLKDGTVVTTYDQLIDWLCEKDDRARVATLDLEGKNKVVYSLPSYD